MRGMTRNTRRQIYIACGIAATALLIYVAMMTAWGDLGVPDALSATQAVVTIAVIVAGAILAYYRLEIFRELHPHLTITQEVSSRKISDGYIHIAVRAILSNRSKVAIEITGGEFWIQHIAPFTDPDVENIYGRFGDISDESIPDVSPPIPFPSIDMYELECTPGAFIIEPGQIDSETYEFIISNEYQTVSLTAFFEDSTSRSNSEGPQGWTATSVYDLN